MNEGVQRASQWLIFSVHFSVVDISLFLKFWTMLYACATVEGLVDPHSVPEQTLDQDQQKQQLSFLRCVAFWTVLFGHDFISLHLCMSMDFIRHFN